MSLNLLKLIAKKQVEFVDFRYTDAKGNWLSVTYEATAIGEDFVLQPQQEENLMLTPDISTAFIDPFNSFSTLVIICNTNKVDDVRTRLQKTLTLLGQNLNIQQRVEFFIFDEIEIKNCPSNSVIKITHTKIPSALRAMRDEITTTLKNIDLRPLNFYEIDKAKCAINLRPTDLLNAADAILKYKYIIKQVALSYGKTATFMPKVLANAKAASLTLELILEKEAAYFYAGIIKHFKALQAFIHTSSASYKDPITKPKFINNRIYFNVDSLMPAYDGFAAILLAGMDGILNKITEENFQSSDSLAASINFLSHNMDFLIKDNVFSKAQISEYIAKKQQEVDKISQSLCALEFKLYYHL